MGLFDEDPFEDLVREFLGDSSYKRQRKKFITGEDEDRIIDFIDDEEYIYLIFELPGFSEKDISVEVRGRELEIYSKKSNSEAVQDYLHQKLTQGVQLKKQIPSFVSPKNFKYTMRNGILEIIFLKTGVHKHGSRKVKID